MRSMAQTRAISRALRAPLEQVVVLAEYDPTAAEEMPNDGPPEPTSPDRDDATSPEQRREIATLLSTLERVDSQEDWKAVARGLAGGSPQSPLSRAQAETVIDRLRERLGRYSTTA
jgi:hypothetical protein